MGERTTERTTTRCVRVCGSLCRMLTKCVNHSKRNQPHSLSIFLSILSSTYYIILLLLNITCIFTQTKFGIEPGDEASIRSVVQSYIEGLFWVLTYYHDGCGSWTWYYPHLYAPLASDLVNIAALPVEFPQGKPFTPLLQLLSVLPPQSGTFLPRPYEELMSSPESPLVEYYPQDFIVDANGKKNAWECVVCIPFIKEDVLVDAVNRIDHVTMLTHEERLRNIPGLEHRFKPTNATAGGNRESRGASVEGAGGAWGNALVDSRDSSSNRANMQYKTGYRGNSGPKKPF